jgi:HEPN domain-containing protein
MNEKSTYWIEIADYDFETAKAMLASKRYLYVGFMCHQVIEKTIKAYYRENLCQWIKQRL